MKWKHLVATAVILGTMASPVQADPFSHKIEKKIQSLGSWAQLAYETVQPDVRQVSPAQLKEFSLDAFHTRSMYDHDNDILLIPELSNDVNEEQILDALSHEFSHILFDNKGNKGIMNLPGYEGPTREEMNAFAWKSLEETRYKKIFEKTMRGSQKRALVGTLEATTGLVIHPYLGIVQQFTTEMKNVGELFRDYPLTNEQKGVLSRQTKSIANMIANFDVGSIQSQIRQAQQLHGASAQKYKHQISHLSDLITSKQPQIDELEDAVEGYYDLSQQVWHDVRTRTGIPSEKPSPIKITDLFPARNYYAQGYLLAAEGQKKMRISIANMETLSPEEFMARTVNSLAEGYRGPVTSINWEVSPKQQSFLRRFVVDGIAVFGESLDAYNGKATIIPNSITLEETIPFLER